MRKHTFEVILLKNSEYEYAPCESHEDRKGFKDASTFYILTHNAILACVSSS